MAHYQCGSCSYQSDHLGEAQQHLHQTGHVCIGKGGVGPAGGKFGKARVVGKAGVSVLAATTIGLLAWKYKGLQEEHEGLQTKHEGLLSMAAGLVVQLAESTAENESLKSENDYLKSATGASKTLKSYDC
ncbi:hypothetical protein WKI65_33130 [Streptomyces sp. MS1.AVA.3]|uniref:hypothetical protein n=1 Tax=Streptomyces TaxID=1883 RepID=UPI0021D92BA1|nr:MULTISPECIES: hypothetical protein [unclassified Streptomyces]UYB37759.1 hypothetical protein SLV14_000017 [Streptomyces sp. Je 1-4]UYB44587.1 hypothetical protein SLV14_007691 [Streptomyces sp. Je 1-4]UZQ33668.1 hypothetical protein SLV14N_000017 [Streptomyces sp. Je 1-4] [Streptomyces sp. Je 1-4 4N24]UZQ41055.1 hypothetical protein SLV14N_007691 [Streptomyces sp. Je 1-4] [Streptomyces sp. Je 1-4 4N24]UZQ41086.1 hypothetical protein SLV14NA_000017 [Streptomyces sp. Je 1-4] [Streptomyces sp